MEVSTIWPFFCPDGRHFATFIHAHYEFPYEEGTLLPGYSGHNVGDSYAPDSSLLAVYFDFTRPPKLFNTGFYVQDTTGVCIKCSVKWYPC